ncbi:MAG: 1-acyl-sn-glycerol-3-phosphate acyltransferase [Flaviaesturariibacter sp.]|nr:1-acyl-sn-glycerol-3-phosphate acyltransferase [Flaviaesturariibacter sp.]
MKLILARFFALWAALCFTVTLLIVFIPIWLLGLVPEPRRSHLLQPIFQGWMSVFFILAGVRRRYTGRRNFRRGENYIVVCNHNSFLDPPLSSPGIPGANKTIAKIEMSRIPLFGIIYKRGSVLVDRKSEESRKSSYTRMRAVLEMGLHMCIYPEGTRNKSREPLQRFHDGAFKLAVDTGKAVIPALIFNAREILPPGKGFYFWPRPVRMQFLPPISPDGKTVAELREEVFAVMRSGLQQTQ